MMYSFRGTWYPISSIAIQLEFIKKTQKYNMNVLNTLPKDNLHFYLHENLSSHAVTFMGM
jgi:hypothetical protein